MKKAFVPFTIGIACGIIFGLAIWPRAIGGILVALQTNQESLPISGPTTEAKVPDSATLVIRAGSAHREEPVEPRHPSAAEPAEVTSPAASATSGTLDPTERSVENSTRSTASTPQTGNANESANQRSDEKTVRGVFVVTSSDCPMKRAPASDAAAMLTVKASKKIWVQEFDGKWLRAFNKAGEPGFIARDCVR